MHRSHSVKHALVFVGADSDSDDMQWLTAYITVNAGESSMDRMWFPNPALMICVALRKGFSTSATTRMWGRATYQWQAANRTSVVRDRQKDRTRDKVAVISKANQYHHGMHGR